MGWSLGLPVVLGLVVILALSTGAVVAPVISLVAYYIVGVVFLTAAVASRLRRRRFLALQQEPPRVVLPPHELATSGLMADDPAEWTEIDSRELERRRVIRRAAVAPVGSILSLGLRTRSEWVRESLTYRAMRGQLDYPTLERILLAQDLNENATDMLLSGLEPDALITLGRLVAGQSTRPRDQEVVRAIEEVSMRMLDHGDIRLSEGSRRWLAERLIATDRLEAAIPLVEGITSATLTSRLLKADILNPFRPGSVQSSQELWLASVNSIYGTYGLEPVELKQTGSTPYDRLQADAPEKVHDGPLISVIMSCFKPGEEIRTAVDAMIAQTWQNWELLIADDASPPGHDGVLEGVAALDSRIKVLRFAENRGTYIRRNDALLVAEGEFVTMQDSDDWVHPRRLELQARHLMANPDLAANLSHSLRVSEELRFVQPRGARLRLAETSLFFRREEVVGRIGYFDSVRKAADSEYRLRLEAAFGNTVPIIDTLSPLSLIRHTDTSLSGSDIGDGWMAPERLAYINSAGLWHDRVRTEKASAVVPYPLDVRPFPAHNIVRGKAREHRELDLVLVLDGRSHVRTPEQLQSIVEEITALVDTGAKVGILHMMTLSREDGSPHLAAALQALVNDGQVVQVLLGDDMDVDTVIVRYASGLQAAPQAGSNLRARRLVVLEDRGASGDFRGRNFARADVEASAVRVFGREPEWLKVEGHAHGVLLDLAEAATRPG